MTLYGVISKHSTGYVVDIGESLQQPLGYAAWKADGGLDFCIGYWRELAQRQGHELVILNDEQQLEKWEEKDPPKGYVYASNRVDISGAAHWVMDEELAVVNKLKELYPTRWEEIVLKKMSRRDWIIREGE